jgi:patatin-like phospholipase/acyl hydrolase
MKKVRKTQYHDREILTVDYREANGDRMIEVFNEAKVLVSAENKKVLILNLFNNKNHITPNFIRHLEREVPAFESLIEKNAVVGLTEVQKWILKGINLWYKKKIHHFDTVDEALDFLVDTAEPGTE